LRSVCLVDPGPPPVLREAEVARPKPREGEVLIRVRAAGVTPTELGWYPTSHDKNGGKRTGGIPSHEFSGEIGELGEGVTGLSIGQEIYGMNDWFEDGALAEYCITRPEWVAPKPERISHAEAASVPIGALTAWQGLFDKAGLRAGERVLVHGGAGAVGVFVIQLARHRGARLITTVSKRNAEFVRGLGADEAIDYHEGRFEDAARDIDVVFDCVGGETLQRSWGVLKPKGRLVTIVAGGDVTQDERIKRAFFIVEPKREQLVEIGKLIDAGELRPVVDAVLPLSEASRAYDENLERTGRGKVVVSTAG
jgi:NADPH:quinone reductase-like Zn-dependent oxidoreductase